MKRMNISDGRALVCFLNDVFSSNSTAHIWNVCVVVSTACLSAVTARQALRDSRVLGWEIGSWASWIKAKWPGEREFSFLFSLCPPQLFLIPLLLSLCLALLEKAINLGQACSNSSLTHSGKEIHIPAQLLHSIVHKLRSYEGHNDFRGLLTSHTGTDKSFVLLKDCGDEDQTWWESDIRDDILPMMEGHQVLQGVCIHNKEAAVIQAHRQGFAVRGEATATAACGGQHIW